MNRVKKVVQAERVYRQGYSGKGVRIAVLDTGMYPHKDLIHRIIEFRNFAGRRQIIHDDNGHGTHVCGIICGDGTASNGRITGIAPQAEIVVLKVLDQYGNGQTEHVLRALEWVQENKRTYGIRILNFSVGFLPESEDKDQISIMKALEGLWDENVVVVTAAGNNGPKEGTVTVPGISKKVITVGACDDDGSGNLPKGYSGRGPTECCIVKPEILAPGSNILSTGHRGMRYVYKSGTSMATPVVCGALALALEKKPYLRPEHLKLKLYESTLGFERVGKAWGVLKVDEFMRLI